MACSGLIFLWVEDELQFDHNHLNRANIYMVMTNEKVDNGMFTHSSTPGPLAASIKAKYPQIAEVCRAYADGSSIVYRYKNEALSSVGMYADPSLFRLFTFHFVAGDTGTVFSQPYSLVLTQSMAKKYFGSDPNPIGKALAGENKQVYTVTGIVEDAPANSSIKFDWVAPLESIEPTHKEIGNWNNNCLTTYVMLKPGADPASLNKEWANPNYDYTIANIDPSSPSTSHHYLFAMNNWNLHDEFVGGLPTGGGRIQYVRLTWENKDPSSHIVISQRLVSAEYMRTLGMQIQEGRDFQMNDVMDFNPQKFDTTRMYAVVVTSSMANLMGESNPLGKSITMSGVGLHMQVVGVIKDYVYGDIYGVKDDPVVFYCIPNQTNMMYVRLNPQTPTAEALARVGAVMKKMNPGNPFEYSFVDDQFNSHFQAELLVSRLSRAFAGLAILISCMDLFGLAAYTAERRTKEIGIRKVLGASSGSMALLLSRDFLKLVLVSCLLSFPIAWWAMSHWLQGYAYRIDLQWWIFAGAGLLAAIIALATVSYQALRVASANPVKSLRTE